MLAVLATLLLAAAQPAAQTAAVGPPPPDLPEWRLPEEDEEFPLPPAEPPGEAPLVLAGEAIEQGVKREVTLRLSESFAGVQVDIPVIVVRGRTPGPSLCLIGGVHGDELNGTEIVRLAMESQSPDGLSGTLIGVPIANMFGFVNQTRYLPDRRDLNRHFPGSPGGSTAARVAYRLFDAVVRRCTHLVDLHTGSLNRTNVAQIRGDLRDPKVLALARGFGASVLVHSRGAKGTLRRTATEAGVAAILYEGGETLRFQQPEIKRGVAGIKSVLAALGMRRGPTLPADEALVLAGSGWVRAERGGLLELIVRPGDAVRKGDLLATITDPSRREKGYVRAPRNGWVLGEVVTPMVLPGFAVVDLGVEGPLPQPRAPRGAGAPPPGATDRDGDSDIDGGGGEIE